MLTELGRVLAVLHNGGVVHGGLSCSCVLVRGTDQTLVGVTHDMCKQLRTKTLCFRLTALASEPQLLMQCVSHGSGASGKVRASAVPAAPF